MPIFAPGTMQGMLDSQGAMRQQAEQQQIMAARKQQMDYQAWQQEQARAESARQLGQQQADVTAWRNYGGAPPPAAAPANSPAPAPAPSTNFAPTASAGSPPPPGNPVPPYRTVANTQPPPQGQPQGQGGGQMQVPPVQAQQQPQQGMTLDGLIASFRKPTPEYPNGIPEQYWSGLIKERMPMLEYQDRQRAAAIVERKLSDSERKAAEAEARKAPAMRTRIEGDKEVQEQWNPQTQSYDKVGEGPRFARQVAGMGGRATGGGGAPSAGGKASSDKIKQGAASLLAGTPKTQIVSYAGTKSSAEWDAIRAEAFRQLEATGMSTQQAAGVISENGLDRVALGKALTQQAAIVAGTERLSKTVYGQIGLLNDQLEKSGLNTPAILNKPYNKLRKDLSSGDLAEVDVYMAGLAREVQKLNTAVASNAQLHITASQLYDKLINRDMSVGEAKRATDAFKKEMEVVNKASLDTVDELRGNIRDIGSEKPAGAAGGGQWSVKRID